MTASTATAARDLAINEIARHATSRTTGTTTTVERAGGSDLHWLGVDEEWAVYCEHGTITGSDSRREAWMLGAHPEHFCDACRAAAASYVHPSN